MKHLTRIACAVLISLAISAQASDFSISSPSLKIGGSLPQIHVFNGFGCVGDNKSPALSWQNAPTGTQSFAITTYDPDAPTGSGWWHWVVYNLPESVTHLPQGAGALDGQTLPIGALQGRTDFGAMAFGGACPPQGDKPHRYQLTVYALKVDKLPVPADASPALIGYMIHANKLGSAKIQAQYSR